MLKRVAMAVLSVWPADAPAVRCEGCIWICIGPRRGLASAQDERILNKKRHHLDRACDAAPIRGCALSELKRMAFEQEFLPRAIASDVLAANERSYEQRLAALGMIASADDPLLTVPSQRLPPFFAGPRLHQALGWCGAAPVSDRE